MGRALRKLCEEKMNRLEAEGVAEAPAAEAPKSEDLGSRSFCGSQSAELLIMASAALPSSSPLFASISDSSHSQLTTNLPQQQQPDGAATNHRSASSPDVKPPLADHFAYLDDLVGIEKFKKYEVDYTRRLLAKYFSKKDILGGNIFDEKTMIDNETILSSRWPCTQSFTDPARAFEDEGSGDSTSGAETPTNMSNRKHSIEKSC